VIWEGLGPKRWLPLEKGILGKLEAEDTKGQRARRKWPFTEYALKIIEDCPLIRIL
jgi:hypothetical protein